MKSLIFFCSLFLINKQAQVAVTGDSTYINPPSPAWENRFSKAVPDPVVCFSFKERGAGLDIRGSEWIALAAIGIASAFDALDQYRINRSEKYYRRFPGLGNPETNWENKWEKDEFGRPMPGVERFPLSSTVLVGFTDRDHGNRTVRNAMYGVSIISFAPGSRKRKLRTHPITP
jgi:hypothetical protein